MRNRVSWVVLVAAVSLAIGALTTTPSYSGGTDLAATPCTITASPVTIVKDPVIRFDAKVDYANGRAPVEKAPATTVVFRALPSGERVGTARLTRSFRADLKVPAGTTEIGVQLMTGNHVDATRPRTEGNIGRYPLDKHRTTSVTWLIPNAAKAQTDRKTHY